MNTEYQIILAAENIETAVKSQLFHPHIPSLVGVLNAWQTETQAANPDFSQINNINISETFKKKIMDDSIIWGRSAMSNFIIEKIKFI